MLPFSPSTALRSWNVQGSGIFSSPFHFLVAKHTWSISSPKGKWLLTFFSVTPMFLGWEGARWFRLRAKIWLEGDCNPGRFWLVEKEESSWSSWIWLVENIDLSWLSWFWLVEKLISDPWSVLVSEPVVRLLLLLLPKWSWTWRFRPRWLSLCLLSSSR